MLPAKSGALFRHENPNLIYWLFFTKMRFCPLCQELNHKIPLKFSLFFFFSFVCFPAASSSKLASDENCRCFALLQFSLKDECSLPSVESNMIKRKDFVPYVLVERLSKECCNHRLIVLFCFLNVYIIDFLLFRIWCKFKLSLPLFWPRLDLVEVG